METEERDEPTHPITPDDATPDDDVDVPKPPDPDPEHVVEDPERQNPEPARG